MNLTQIKQAIKNNGGATLTSDLKEATIKSGYMVSLQDHELKTSIESLTNALLEKYKLIAKHKNAFIGFWLDNDALYVDISNNIHDKKQAIKTAKENKQLAIYDCSTTESLYI